MNYDIYHALSEVQGEPMRVTLRLHRSCPAPTPSRIERIRASLHWTLEFILFSLFMLLGLASYCIFTPPV